MKFTTPLARRSSQLLKFTQIILSSACPHCDKHNSITRHGYLKGASLTSSSVIERDLRFFCSNRYSNTGCGSTFSILFSTFIPRHSMLAGALGQFLESAVKTSVHKAWHASDLPFSIRSSYRWFKRFKVAQSLIRPLLSTSLPELSQIVHSSQEAITLSLMKKRLPHGASFISQFQLTFQTPIFHHITNYNPHLQG